MINYVEHPSRGYAPRTKHNATTADLTLAFAADLGTAGERLTHQMAGMRYLGFEIDKDNMTHEAFLSETIGRISRECEYKNVRVLNVAGNGIYTLNYHRINQAQVNLFVYRVLKGVIENSQVNRIISGGQTGVDIASGVAALVLGVDCELTFPKGFLQRGLDKIDKQYTKEQIQSSVEAMAQELRQQLVDLATLDNIETQKNAMAQTTSNTVEATEVFNKTKKPAPRTYSFSWMKK